MIATEAGRLAGQLDVHDTWLAVLVANWIFPRAQVPVGYDRQLLTSAEAKGPNECYPSPTKGGDELAKILIRRSWKLAQQGSCAIWAQRCRFKTHLRALSRKDGALGRASKVTAVMPFFVLSLPIASAEETRKEVIGRFVM
jgi:hypothetical protein